MRYRHLYNVHNIICFSVMRSISIVVPRTFKLVGAYHCRYFVYNIIRYSICLQCDHSIILYYRGGIAETRSKSDEHSN